MDDKPKTGQARSLRKRGTLAEKLLWRKLGNRGAMGFKFRRQVPVGPYVVDFYCPQLKLVVELDGATHEYKWDYERKREEFLVSRGLQVLHFSNHDVIANTQWAVNRILSKSGVAGFERW